MAAPDIKLKKGRPNPADIQLDGGSNFITADQWVQPFSQPRVSDYTAGRFAVALIASGFIGTLVPPGLGVPGTNVVFASTNTIVPYSQTLLYQSITVPVPLAVPTALPDRWVQPFSQPTLRKGPNAALQAPSLFFVGSDSARDTSWRQPFSEPVRAKPTVQPAASVWRSFPSVVAVAGNDDVQFAASQTIVPYERTLLYQSIAQPVQVTAEVVTVDKWRTPFSEPVRAKPKVQPEALAPWATFTPALSTGWIPPLAEPVRAKPKVQPAALAWSYFTPVTVTAGTDDVRFSASQTVVPYERILLYQSIAQPVQVPAAETVTVDKWFASLSQPTRRKVNNQPEALAWSYFTPAAATPGNATSLQVDFFNQLQQPVRQSSAATLAVSWLAPLGAVTSAHVFQCNVFQQNVFQNTCTTDNVFQCNVFQHNVFQNTCPFVPPVTLGPARQPGGDDGGFYRRHWEELRKLVERCKDEDDEECREVLAEAAETVEVVLAASEADAAKLDRLRAAIEDARLALTLAEVQQAAARMYRELADINAELMRIRAEEEEEEEAIMLLHMLH